MDGGTRILLVDDEPLLLTSIRRVLARVRPNAIVVYASSAEAAEWQLRCTTLKLVVTDMRMQADPRAGMRVVRAAREAKVPVAIMTSVDPVELVDLVGPDVEILAKGDMTVERLTNLVERAFS